MSLKDLHAKESGDIRNVSVDERYQVVVSVFLSNLHPWVKIPFLNSYF